MTANRRTLEERVEYVKAYGLMSGTRCTWIEGDSRVAVTVLSVSPKCMVTVRLEEEAFTRPVGSKKLMEPFSLRLGWPARYEQMLLRSLFTDPQ